MRVLIFHPALAPYRLDLFNRLAQLCDLRIVFLQENLTCQKFDQKALTAELQADNAYLTTGFLLGGRNFRFGVREEINKFKPDVVVSSEFSFVTVLCFIYKCLFSKFKLVVWTDDNPDFILREVMARRLVRKLIVPKLDGLILVSEDAASIYNGYDVPCAIVPILPDETVFRSKIQQAIPQAKKLVDLHSLYRKKVVLFVGRLSPEKGIDRLISCFLHVAKQSPEAVLVLVGAGSERAKLEALVADLSLQDKVIFTGRKEGLELLAWYYIGSVFALLSEYEPFGAVVGEALTAGMPAVCSSNAGAKALIVEGVNGAVVDPEDCKQVVSSICYWLESSTELAEVNLGAVKSSRTVFGFDSAVSAYVKILVDASAV